MVVGSPPAGSSVSVGDAPGVYRRDVVLAPPPALVTGSPIIFGYATGGPVLDPVLVASVGEFSTTFTANATDGYLAEAVEAFFVNGGQRAWIVRLEDTSTNLPAFGALVHGLAAATMIDADLVCAPDIVRQRGLGSGWAPGSVLPPDPEEVALMQEAVVADCERSQTRVAILDALPAGVLATLGAGAGASTAAAIDAALLSQIAHLEGSTDAALYHPWISPVGETGRFVPPCGAVAGIIARSDQQVGVHKAPANEPVMGIVDVQDIVDAHRQGPLNAKGINCIRAFGGRGIRVWGARTVNSDDPTWRYLNIRRVVLTAARWAALALQEVAFEPSMSTTWARATRRVETYMGDLYAQGALFGSTANDAFSVSCDATTNPPEVRQLGQLVLEVTLNPAPPNEVVLLRLVRDVTGVTIQSSSSPG